MEYHFDSFYLVVIMYCRRELLTIAYRTGLWVNKARNTRSCPGIWEIKQRITGRCFARPKFCVRICQLHSEGWDPRLIPDSQSARGYELRDSPTNPAKDICQVSEAECHLTLKYFSVGCMYENSLSNTHKSGFEDSTYKMNDPAGHLFLTHCHF